MTERRCVIVAGFPRSGTSWLAKCLSFAPGFTYYREPDNFDLVFANLNLAWFSANVPHARQVCVLRHPCGQFASWKRLGWEPDPVTLLENPRLVGDHLHPFADLLRSADSFWERSGALWAATAYVLHRQTQADGGRLIVAYEWLCHDPIARFRELYDRLGMTWSARIERRVGETNVDGNTRTYSVKRPTAFQVDRWKQRVPPEEIDACRRFVEPFGLPYYPDFEPYAEAFSGAASVTSHG